jgi:Plasmid pRiA4b ORF-3-like protein
MKPQDAFADSPIAQVARLKITLDYSQPQIVRRIEVPLTSTLYSLHEVIQAVMLFESYHLFQFDVGPRGHETHYGIPNSDGFMDVIDAKRATLDQLIDAKFKKFTYTYDFGDDWRHTVTVEAVTSADPALVYPRFIDGARRAPPEDVGGQPGFENFISVMADPKHPEYTELKRWYGRAFNPDDIAEPQIADRLAKLAKRKPSTKPKIAKPKHQIN